MDKNSSNSLKFVQSDSEWSTRMRQVVDQKSSLKEYCSNMMLKDGQKPHKILKEYEENDTIERNKKMSQVHQNQGQIEEIGHILEPLIRRIIREELSRIIKATPGTFYLDPDMPIYQDMEDILQRKTKGQIKMHSHEEVWGE